MAPSFTLRRFLLLASVAALQAAESKAADAPKASLDERHHALFKEHCISCHGEKTQKGKFRVDELPFTITNLETAEKWQKVLNQLNSGEMPPEDEKQPASEGKADFLDELSNTIVAARRLLSDQKGRITLRRLNQREYRNTLRALLGVQASVSELPSDTGAGSFDTVGSNLFMSSTQFEQYRGLARDALDEAFDRHQKSSLDLKQRLEVEEPYSLPYQRSARWLEAFGQAVARPDNAQIVATLRNEVKNESEFRRAWSKIQGAPDPADFGFDPKGDFADAIGRIAGSGKFPENVAAYLKLPALDRGAYLANYGNLNLAHRLAALGKPIPGRQDPWGGYAPAGEYILRVRVAAADNAPVARRFIEFGTGGERGAVQSTHEVTGTLEAPQVIEIPFSLPWLNSSTDSAAGRDSRSLFIRERGIADRNHSYHIGLQARAKGKTEPIHVIWVDWMELDRVKTADQPVPPGLAALSIPLGDAASAPSNADLRKAFEAFCLEAFRAVPTSAEYLDRLVALYGIRRNAGDKHGAALKYALSVVLSSPSFLYLEEPSPESKRHRISGVELATRLSYFLWGAPPDAALRELGRSGKLSRPEVLLAETDRLLNDPRSKDFTRPFLHQWWGVDRLEFFQPDRMVFPNFDSNTKRAAREELYETFAHLLKHNASAGDLLKSDYVIVNGLLAQYYGLGGVHGDDFRKVSLPPDSPRGGIFGMAGFSYMGRNGQRTSPVERGAWVLRKLLNDPPPPPPANVPSITRLENQPLTTRQRVLAHQEEPQCASCHRKIDPIGFGLENFDAVGQWRTVDIIEVAARIGPGARKDARKTAPIDPAAAFHKGPAFKSYFELRDLIHGKSEAFARGLSAALVEYGLGRPVGFSDAPLLEAIVQRAKNKHLALREFIHALIASEEFQTK